MHPILGPFERNVAVAPDRVAVGDQSLTLDYRGLRSVAGGLAARVADRTGRPHVGILAPTSSATVAAILACWYAGKTPVPLNFLLAPEELRRIVRDADLDLILTIDLLAELAVATGVRSLALNAQTITPGQCDAPAAHPADLATLIYTSGTSGDPKGVRLSFDNLARNCAAAVEQMRLDADQVFLGLLPQFHSFGFTMTMLMPLALGASVWYLPRFSPLTVTHMVAEKKVTIFIAIASMYGALCKLRHAEPAAFASVRLAVSGGEPLPASVAARFKERFGVEVLEGWGLTETSPVVSVDVPWDHRPGSVGRALPGIEVRAIDAEENELPADQEGELVVRGHCVMQGYHNKPEQTAAVIRDGRLHTGDIGKVDGDGFIHITGRAKEMMIIGGENVFPREIEEVLARHPAVAEAAVIGVPDALRGESPLAFVILREGESADDKTLRAFCRERLPGYKAPRQVRIADDLPRGPTGKILKRALPTS